MEMGISRSTLLSSATAAVLALPLWTSAALAQETQATEGEGTEQAQQTQQSGEAGQAAGGEQGQGDPSDALVARLGDAEIRSSDVMRAMGQLPSPLNRQPPEMLAATAIQQLVLREAILQQAREADLAQDPEVQSRVAAATQAAEEDALLQVWLERELQTRVPSQAVDQAYAALQAITTGELPPLEQLRGEIEQNLRRQAMEEIQTSLLTGADITFFGPDGQPRAGAGQEGAVSGNAGAGTDVGTGAETDAGGVAGAGTEAETEAGGDAGGGTDAGVEAGTGTETETGAGTGGDAETGTEGEAGAETDAGTTGAGTDTGTDAGGGTDTGTDAGGTDSDGGTGSGG